MKGVPMKSRRSTFYSGLEFAHPGNAQSLIKSFSCQLKVCTALAASLQKRPAQMTAAAAEDRHPGNLLLLRKERNCNRSSVRCHELRIDSGLRARSFM